MLAFTPAIAWAAVRAPSARASSGTVLAAPKGLAVTAGDMANRLTWLPVSASGIAYRVERAPSPSGPWTSVSSRVSATTFTERVTEVGSVYYRVTTLGKGKSVSAPSGAVANTSIAMSSVVATEAVVLRASNGELTLSFDAGTFSGATQVSVTQTGDAPGILPGTVVTPPYLFQASSPLALPAHVTMRYRIPVEHFQVAATLARAVDLATYDSAKSAWVTVPTSVDTTAQVLSADMPHFSYWQAEAIHPHGTSPSKTSYCSGICHDLVMAPGSPTVLSSADSDVCYHCHGNTSSTLTTGAGDPWDANVQAENFQCPGQTFDPASESKHPVAAPGTTSGLACIQCHDPHADPTVSPGLLRSYDAVTGRAVAGSAGSAYCATCHGKRVNPGADAAVPGYWERSGGDKSTGFMSTTHAVADPSGTRGVGCLLCHAGHSSKDATSLLPAAGVAVCTGCHDSPTADKPPLHSYQGLLRFGQSGHKNITSAGLPAFAAPIPASESFMAWEATRVMTPSTPGTPLSASRLSALHSIDDVRAVTSLATANGQHDVQMYRFKSPVLASRATTLSANWTGYGEEVPGYETSVSVWNIRTASWQRLHNGVIGWQTTKQSALTTAADYIDSSGYIWMLADATKVIQSTIVDGPRFSANNGTSVTVYWKTAGYADSRVAYGPTTSYGSWVTSSARTIEHTVVVPLSSAGRYHFRATSVARDGDSDTSGDIETNNARPVLTPAVLSLVGRVAYGASYNAKLAWSLTEPTFAPYQYQISIADNGGWSQTYAWTSSTSATITVQVPYDVTRTYTWSVIAKDKDGFLSARSATSSFSLTDNTVRPTTPVAVSPISYSTVTYATLNGDLSAEATFTYLPSVSSDGDALEYQVTMYSPYWVPAGWPVVAQSTWSTALSATITGLTNAPSAYYYWTVQARDSVHPGLVSFNSSPWFLLYVTDTAPIPGPKDSCPILYTWDGTKFRYITDVMGRGPLGVPMGATSYRYPIPVEESRIDGSALVADNGVYRVMLRNDNNEIEYIDQVTLKAVDHPAGTEVYLNDVNTPSAAATVPVDEIYTVRDPKPVVSATYDCLPLYTGRTVTGQDITSAVASEDQIYAPANFYDDNRYTFDLGELGDPATIKLIMTAWTDFPSTTERVAVNSSGIPKAQRVLEVQAPDGSWVKVGGEIAVVPGLTKTVVWDLTGKFPAGTTRYKVRMRGWYRTNIDKVVVDTTPREAVTVSELAPSTADLRYSGMARFVRTPAPTFDYTTLLATSIEHDGWFTKFGDVKPLLTAADDFFVIMDSGDELALTFAEKPMAPGMERTYIIHANGYHQTITGKVDPLPFQAMSNYPYAATEHYPDDAAHAEYLATWNTRAHGAAAAAAPATAADPAAATIWSDPSLLGAAAAASDTMHRSLNTDQVSVSVGSNLSYQVASAREGCAVCHAVHGTGVPAWDGLQAAGDLYAPPDRLCTADGTGGCHSLAANSAGGVNITAKVTASTDDRMHHDLTDAAQKRTGARISCTDCHNPHTENASARVSDPATMGVSIGVVSSPYLGLDGSVWVLVGGVHDASPPAIVTGPSIVGSSTASTVLTPTVTWTTNELASTYVDYGLSASALTSIAGSPALVTSHSTNLTGLAVDTTYYWRARSVDAVGNVATSTVRTYSTALPLWTISGLRLDSSIINYADPPVVWTTSDYTTTRVEWGASQAGPFSSADTSSAMTMSHSGNLHALAYGNVYWWRVTGVDALGRAAYSTATSYTAIPATPTITSGPTVRSTAGNEGTPTVTWTTSDINTTMVAWGDTSQPYFGLYSNQASDTAATTAHSMDLPGMTVGSTYFIRVRGVDSLGRATTSDEIMWTPILHPTKPVVWSADQSTDSYLGISANIPATWTASVSGDGDAVQYLPYLNGVAAAGGWQSGTSYTWTGLWAGTYTVRVLVRDVGHPYLTTWSDPVNVSVVDYPSGSGSCPFLFTWDGSSYRFEADVMIPGKMANKVATGYQKPNPQDAYRLRYTPSSENGRWKFRLVEERSEVDYMDRLQLFAADVPTGYDVYAEKPSVGGTLKEVAAQLHTVQDPRPVTSAVHVNTGRDVTSLLASQDGQYVVLNDDRENFTYQTIELDLGDISAAPQIKLLVNAVSAFFQTPTGIANSAKFGPRTKIEAQKADGTWVTVPASAVPVPVPPEFARTYVFDITKVRLYGGPKIRLTFLYKTYIDMLKVDTSADQTVTLTESPLLKATLAPHGLDARSGTNPDLYEFVYGVPNSDSLYFPGKYTRFGAVEPLLSTLDDQFVVAGGGDELQVEFQALPSAAAGTQRQLILGTYGFYKDLKNDLEHEVSPMPFSAMSNYPYTSTEHYPDTPETRAYLSNYQTRHQDATYIPIDTTPAQAASAYSPSPSLISYASLISLATGEGAYVTVPSAEPASQYSLDTDRAMISADLVDDTVATVTPAAAYVSQGLASVLPTISSPGVAVSGAELAKAATVNGVYLDTDLATIEGRMNWQVLKFDMSSLTPKGVEGFTLSWTGHGEPTPAHPTTVYLYNRFTGAWDQVATGVWGNDVTVTKRASTSDSGMCLRCHSGSLPSDVVAPTTMKNVGAVWLTPGSGDAHGAKGGGIPSSELSGYSQGAAALPCDTCHDPHGSTNLFHYPTNVNGVSGLTALDGYQTQQLCKACHLGDVRSMHLRCSGCHYMNDGDHSDFTYLLPDESSDCLACHGHNTGWTHTPGSDCHGDCGAEVYQIWPTF